MRVNYFRVEKSSGKTGMVETLRYVQVRINSTFSMMLKDILVFLETQPVRE